jgi:predicted neutral ceramidase superfamily lipid hydrolase
VLWNPKAYANNNTMLHWVKHIYQFCLVYSILSIKQKPYLLSLDAFTAHLTLAVHCAFKAQKATVSIIPGGYTGIVQVLNVSLNKLLKDLIKKEQDNYYNCYIKE